MKTELKKKLKIVVIWVILFSLYFLIFGLVGYVLYNSWGEKQWLKLKKIESFSKKEEISVYSVLFLYIITILLLNYLFFLFFGNSN